MSVLLKGAKSKQNRDFFCLNCLHSYSAKDKLKNQKKVCKNNDYCQNEMLKENNKIIKYDHTEKFMKTQFLINADMDCFPERIDIVIIILKSQQQLK